MTCDTGESSHQNHILRRYDCSIEDLESLLHQLTGGSNVSAIRRAYQFACHAHAGQLRDEGVPYIVHPCRVTRFLIESLRISDPDILCASLLHDVLEDCPVACHEMIEGLFGRTTADYVCMLTKYKGAGFSPEQTRAHYFARLMTAPPEVRIIKLADRLDNIRYLHLSPRRGKIERYIAQTRKYYIPMAEELIPAVAQEMEEILARLDNFFQNSVY